MASVTSNYKEIRDTLNALGDTLRLNRKPKSARKTVGAQILAVTAMVIENRTVNRQQEPDGTPFAPLKPYTLQRKAEQGYPSTISIQSHEMASLEQIMGEQEVSPTEASMDYGLNDWARAKAEKFSEGNSHQEPRPFYDLGTTGEPIVDAFIEEIIIKQQIADLS